MATTTALADPLDVARVPARGRLRGDNTRRSRAGVCANGAPNDDARPHHECRPEHTRYRADEAPMRIGLHRDNPTGTSVELCKRVVEALKRTLADPRSPSSGYRFRAASRTSRRSRRPHLRR